MPPRKQKHKPTVDPYVVHDNVNSPAHYKGAKGMEVIDVIENFGLGFRIGNAVKYLLRAGKKGAYGEQLLKARWYIERELLKYHILSRPVKKK